MFVDLKEENKTERAENKKVSGRGILKTLLHKKEIKVDQRILRVSTSKKSNDLIKNAIKNDY